MIIDFSISLSTLVQSTVHFISSGKTYPSIAINEQPYSPFINPYLP